MDAVITIIVYKVDFPEPVVKMVKNSVDTLCDEIKSTIGKMRIYPFITAMYMVKMAQNPTI